MVIKELLIHCQSILLKKVEDPVFEAWAILCHVLNKDRLFLILHKNDEISDEEFLKANEFSKRRSLGEPFAYITSCKEFMSLDFKVCPGVLIPRPDTEILVEAVIKSFKSKKISLLDLCTGSGAIACSVAHYVPLCTATGVDISNIALEVANENCKNLGLDNRVGFLKCDVLNLPENLGLFDVVVSNPPYIETEAINGLCADVKDYEPHLALDGGADGLEFYRKIVSKAHHILKKGAMLYFEIGYNQAEDVHNIMSDSFCNIEILKDYGGNNRVIFGQLV